MLLRLYNWLKTCTASNEERYLAASVDGADFERRLKVVESANWRGEFWWLSLPR